MRMELRKAVMDKCTCKITPGTSAYGGNQIDSRGCEKHDTRDEIIEQLRQERDNALRYTELLIAERDAAQAGEARAVEALRRCYEGAARQLAEPRDHDDDQYALTAIATDCEAVLAARGPAIDWLAQQRREAVAAWIEKEATKCRQQNGEYYDRGVDCMLREAAALRAGEVGDD